MANLLVFSEDDILGSVTHVDTEQVIIEIENGTIMNKICVGNLVAIETSKQHEKLMQIVQQIDFVPVTSRAKESYDLVDFGFVSKHALVEGGSVLLVDGNVDAEWKSEIDAMVQTESDLFPEIKENL